MLQAAAENAKRNGVAIRIVLGSSDELDPAFGAFHLAAIGRAFHWMDRARTLERLDRLRCSWDLSAAPLREGGMGSFRVVVAAH
jgi:hypothetical protein